MQSSMNLAVLVVLAAFATTSAVKNEGGGDRVITHVVKMLQTMNEHSQKEGDEETTIYGKFKCFCDTDEAAKKALIKKSAAAIARLGATIEETTGDSGELSSDVEALKANMDANKEDQNAAEAIRAKENEAFLGEESDLEASIAQMVAGITEMVKVGADQTLGASADHKKFMAGKGSLVSLHADISKALADADAFLSPEQQKTSQSFLQGPFTGTYSSQSVQVMGIFKEMRDTFKANLAEAIATEKKANAAHTTLMDLKKAAWKEMHDSYNAKQKALGENDAILGSSRLQLGVATETKDENEQLLATLQEMYAKKTKGYENRKLLRANEEAAIAQAIVILNSDAAFSKFGSIDTTSATKGSGMTLDFIQLSARHRRSNANEAARSHAMKALQGAKTARVSNVLTLLEAANPFDTVLVEIKKMVTLIGEEGTADTNKLDWCNKERKENNAAHDKKNKDINDLEAQIDKLSNTINDEGSGLKAQINENSAMLASGTATQTTVTAMRLTENVAYQKDVKNLVQAEELLAKAIKVLSVYYDDLQKKLESGQAFVQKTTGAPEAWKGDGAYTGQQGQGVSAIDELEFIKTETQSELSMAHSDEADAQHAFEDAMTTEKETERNTQKNLVKLQGKLAEKELELLRAETNKKETTADRDAIVNYLASIKAGCDFITSNYDARQKNRATEKTSLETAEDSIKDTPVYNQHELAAKHASYGKCKAKCVANDAVATCKACMADVTVVGYCAGHPMTAGCSAKGEASLE